MAGSVEGRQSTVERGDVPRGSAERPAAVARRPTWSERHRSLASRLLSLLAPVVLLASFGGYCWFAYLGFVEHPAGGGVLGTVVVLSLAVVAFGGLYSARGWWWSPCPLCGHEAARDFRGGQSAPCGCCMAYLRSEGERVFEESDEVVELAAPYAIRPADLGDRKDLLRFPQSCGICGAPATSHKPIKKIRPSSPGAAETHVAAAEGLWGQTAPVCEVHRESDPVEIFQGELQFRSYAHYRAFCRLNGLERRAQEG